MAVTNFIWDELSDNVLLETDETDALTARYTNRPEQFGKLLSQYRIEDEKIVERFYHYDGEYSTRDLTDREENVTDTFIYTAYGEEVARTGTTTNPFGYKGAVGYYTNAETSDIYVRARSYEPAIGRWLSVDPLGFVDGANLYQPFFVPGGIDPMGTIVVVNEREYPEPIPSNDPSAPDPPRADGCSTSVGKQWNWKLNQKRRNGWLIQKVQFSCKCCECTASCDCSNNCTELGPFTYYEAWYVKGRSDEPIPAHGGDVHSYTGTKDKCCTSNRVLEVRFYQRSNAKQQLETDPKWLYNKEFGSGDCMLNTGTLPGFDGKNNNRPKLWDLANDEKFNKGELPLKNEVEIKINCCKGKEGWTATLNKK